MLLRLIVIAALFALTAPDGADDGRKGNQLYREGRYKAAISAYRAGLARLPVEAGPIRTGLYNNLGTAQYQLEQFEQAQEAFANGLAAATTPGQTTRLAYNAGNTAVHRQKLREALAYYRQALVADPNNENAKFNYEYVKRRLQQQQQRSGKNQRQNQQNQENENNRRNQNQSNNRQQQANRRRQNQQNQNQRQQQSSNQQNEQRQNRQSSNKRSSGNQSNAQNNPSASQQGNRQPQPQQAKQISKEDALRILQALENGEKRLLRQMRPDERQSRYPVRKDW